MNISMTNCNKVGRLVVKNGLLFMLIALMVVGGLFSAACSESDTEEAIKIGVLAALTGPMAATEADVVNAVKLALDEVEYKVADRDIELVVEDYQNDPQICVTKMKKLKEMDNVDIVIGPYVTSAGLAIRDYIHENQILWISHVCTSPKFIEDSYTKYFFRSSYNSGHQATAVGAYVAYAVNGYRNVVCMAVDYQAGYDEVAGFKEVFEGLGGTVIDEIYSPMDTLDYGPYMAQIDLENADFVWSFHYGGAVIKYVKALDEYGINDALPIFLSANTLYPPYIDAMGDSAIGLESAVNYIEELGNPENNRFVQSFWDEYEGDANMFTEHAYVAARMAILAIREVEGNVEDVDQMIEFLQDMEIETPRGLLKFESHSPVQDIYHTVVEKVDGELQNRILGTYTDIGPYWLPEGLK